MTDKEEEEKPLLAHEGDVSVNNQELGSKQRAEPAPLTWFAIIMFSFPGLSQSMMFTLTNTWITYLYLPPTSDAANLIGYLAFSGAMLFGRLCNAFWGVEVGYLSDQSKLSMGRRRPFILFGTPIFAVLTAMLFFPPDPTVSTANTVYFMVLYIAWNFFFCSVLTPYNALFAEVGSETQRLKMTSTMGIFNLFGMLLTAVVGPFLYFFDETFPDGWTVAGITFTSGLQICALICGLFLFSFLIPAFVVSEQASSTRKDNSAARLWTETIATLSNPAFRTMCFSLNVLAPMANVMLSSNLPYIFSAMYESETGIIKPGQGSLWLGLALVITIVGSLAGVPIFTFLGRRFGKRRVLVASLFSLSCAVLMIFLSHLAPDPAIVGFVAIVLVSLPSSALFIFPNAVYADVVDYDESLTGIRREGMYAGAKHFFNKIGIALAQVMFIAMLDLGKTPDNPTGVIYVNLIGSALFLAASITIYFFPVNK